MYKRFFKRVFDFSISFLGILVLSPFFALFTVVNAIAMRGNPFFVQERPGKGGKIFKMIKYRTMNNKKDADGKLLPDKDRLTKFGKIARTLSIDELPELGNILVGQMSIVGPRPLLVRYLPLYNDFQAQRHNVRPGLTGLAQVSGRNAITWDEKFEKDVFYVNNCSMWLDIKIFFLTIKKVLVSDGISQAGQATMEFFLGNMADSVAADIDVVEKNEGTAIIDVAEKNDESADIDVAEKNEGTAIIDIAEMNGEVANIDIVGKNDETVDIDVVETHEDTAI